MAWNGLSALENFSNLYFLHLDSLKVAMQIMEK